MCMGCTNIAMSSQDGKAPDSTETLFYFAIFVFRLVFLQHFHRKMIARKAHN